MKRGMFAVWGVFWMAILAIPAACVAGDPRNEFIPPALTETKVVQNLDAELPAELIFKDDQSQMIRLGDLFDGKIPVIVSMNYSNCPMLCVLQLNGLIDSLREIDLVAGRDYRIVSVSLDPEETAEQAAATKQKYLASYEREADAAGWHFLTGTEHAVASLAKTVGITYVYLPKKKEYSHPAVFCLCTPEGRISRYHYGIEFPPQTLRLSLVEASEGKIGTLVDGFLLICFHYDETEGRYAPAARNLMKVGGGLAVCGLGLIFWLCHRHRKQVMTVSVP
ncbi:MAG: SCO family protein [Planctomycetaceae bacterium]|nr:SCO family protein [Planctomycetaceae bacterium]